MRDYKYNRLKLRHNFFNIKEIHNFKYRISPHLEHKNVIKLGDFYAQDRNDYYIWQNAYHYIIVLSDVSALSRKSLIDLTVERAKADRDAQSRIN